MFVEISGIEFCGKTTQLDLLKEKYIEGYTFIRQPGQTDYGKVLRAAVKDRSLNISKRAVSLTMLTDRADVTERIIKPALDRGDNVITDSGSARGAGYAYEDKFETWDKLNTFACDGILPDMVIILKISNEEFNRRITVYDRGEDCAIEERELHNMMMIQERIMDWCRWKDVPYTILDASLPKYTLHDMIVKILEG